MSLARILFGTVAYAGEPVPSFDEEAGGSSNRAAVGDSFNEQINPFTGKLQIHATDLFLPGNGDLDIKAQRSYNSLNSFDDPALGMGWSIGFGKVTRRATVHICAQNVLIGNAPAMHLPDGSRQVLYLSEDMTHTISPSRWEAECAPTGN